MEEMTLIIGDTDPGCIHLNPKDHERLGKGKKVICKIVEPMTMRDIAVIAKKDPTIGEGEFMSSRELTFQLGIEDGFPCYIQRFDKEPVPLSSITLELDSMGDKTIDIAKYLAEDRDVILKYLKGRLVSKMATLPIDDLGLSVEVFETIPDLKQDEFAIFENIECIKISQKYGNYFNGILLIDASSSMVSEKQENMMSTIKNEEFLRQLKEIGGEVKEFIDAHIKGRTSIRRFDSAILAILGFFRAKVAKGRGEKITVILYSNTAQAIEIDGGDGEKISWISGGSESEENQRKLISSIMAKVSEMEHAQTNLDAALQEAHRVSEMMLEHELADGTGPKDGDGNPITNPLVVMLLTDGKATVGRTPVTIAKELFKDRNKTIVHTVGLGNDVDESELKAIASMCRGKYHKTNDAQELFMFYDKEASDFSTIKSTSAIGEILDSTDCNSKGV